MPKNSWSWLSFCLLTISALALSLMLPFSMAAAGELSRALTEAYAYSPILKAERARLRATDEDVARATSGYRPTLSASGEIGEERLNTDPPSLADGVTRPKRFSLTLSQPIFRGFRTVNAVKEAEASSLAARENLRNTEQQVLLDAVGTYMDVVRDRSIVNFREQNVALLRQEVQATEQRLRAGDVTRTDVAQARARSASARSELDLARAQVQSSRANFERIFGYPANAQTFPLPIHQLLSQSLSDAIEIAQSENPAVTSAILLRDAAEFAVDRIEGEFLPEVNLEASYSREFQPSRLTVSTEKTVVLGRVNVPLYQAGEVSARARQARQSADGRGIDIEQARLRAKSDAITAWAQWRASEAQIVSDQAQVSATQIALRGVQQEFKAGQRTVLNVLDAQQESINAEVQLVSTRRDMVVASYALLAAMGRLTASDLGLHADIYDAGAYLSTVRHKPWGVTVTASDFAPDDAANFAAQSGGWETATLGLDAGSAAQSSNVVRGVPWRGGGSLTAPGFVGNGPASGQLGQSATDGVGTAFRVR